MKIIVGLGNFGDKYAYNFHNMGFLAAECLADRLGWKFDKRECSASLAAGYVKGEKVIIARPLTFMNLSGQAVKQLMAKYKAGEGDIAVIYDDIDLPKGTIRVREKGSAGTHNGMRNIIAEIKTENFRRIRALPSRSACACAARERTVIRRRQALRSGRTKQKGACAPLCLV